MIRNSRTSESGTKISSNSEKNDSLKNIMKLNLSKSPPRLKKKAKKSRKFKFRKSCIWLARSTKALNISKSCLPKLT